MTPFYGCGFYSCLAGCVGHGPIMWVQLFKINESNVADITTSRAREYCYANVAGYYETWLRGKNCFV